MTQDMRIAADPHRAQSILAKRDVSATIRPSQSLPLVNQYGASCCLSAALREATVFKKQNTSSYHSPEKNIGNELLYRE